MNRAVRLIAMLAVSYGHRLLGGRAGLGMPARDGFLFSVGVIVALVPEGLLPTLSLSLAMSATRMAHRGALVRRLESVETLGSTNIICTDKTGTITTNQMTVVRLVLPVRRYTTTGAGYDPQGHILIRRSAGRRGRQRRGATPPAELPPCAGMPGSKSRMAAGVLGRPDRRCALGGCPQRRHRARGRGASRPGSESSLRVQRQRMSTVHILPSGRHEVLTKGSPESILPLCKSRVDQRDRSHLGEREA